PHLRHLQENEYKRLCESQLMGEVESFAIELSNLAGEHNCPPLRQFAEELQEASDLFDIDLINSRLERFPRLADELARPLPSKSKPR
ncbi:MAG: hypothetical protein ACAI35_27000, partial [Candidatus Methylacidiphilales bacterium]|nr:hypothetical protein [Candidatus Methylacidiphilales bacterium]